MLVLTRRLGEEIVIDGDILITVVAVKGNQIRLGITAPPAVAVDRREVRERRAAWDDPPHLPVPVPAGVEGLTDLPPPDAVRTLPSAP
jgi:carbon storage regulator